MKQELAAQLEKVRRILELHGIDHGLIGAGALTVHGFPRSTFDVDLMVTTGRVLSEDLWTELREAGSSIQISRGDMGDPLLGVVRIGLPGNNAAETRDGPAVIDIVILPGPWAAEILERSRQRALFAGVRLRVVSPADLVLLKLYAGGTRDRIDVQALLEGPKGAEILREVDRRVADLPEDARESWSKWRSVR